MVGHRHEFLELQVGTDWPGFTESNAVDDWMAAIERARSIDPSVVETAVHDGRRHASEQWGRFLQQQ